MKKRLGILLLGSMLNTNAHALDLNNLSKDCEQVASSLMMGYTPLEANLDKRIFLESYDKVIFSISNITVGYDIAKKCLNEAGIQTPNGIRERDLKTIGMSFKTGNNCVQELSNYDYPMPNGTYNIQIYEVDESPKMCVGMIYQTK